MRLATYDTGHEPRVGIVLGDELVDAGFQGSMLELITRWESLRAELVERAAVSGERRPIHEVHLCAPVPRPGKIFAIGLNYADHIAESKLEAPKRQIWFTKAQTSVNGPFDPILIAPDAPFVDYEVELVAVIGKRGKRIPAARAPEHVFGYCVGNDVTERMWQHASPQWSLGKSFDTHAPFGPWITTADEIADPHALEIRCLVNSELRQHSNTKHLVFDLWQQIEHLSAAMTLEPGDVIFTGTPGGVGAAMDPRVFLKAGDVVRCEIEQLGAISGTLANEL
jgi:2-keto-4-pentenoate hydratase/2-oxohepta-3-ene-1,7-dioic acid hydratase in catechol pathway